jgi:3-dehydroquinate synthase
LYGDRIDGYFAKHNIPLTKLVCSGMEAGKNMAAVGNILKTLKQHLVARNEPVLVIGGGVIADLAGFATALYDRNTPYVMLCTSIVSGIDAGPSPRTCANDYGYKNLYGSFHPPVLTLTDRTLWSSLHEGWLRHGIAEIIKMAIVKDWSLFQLLEGAGSELIYSKFGNKCPENKEFGRTCDLLVGKAMHSYVRSEYGNLYETHQCRPHAYGHTWSPGYELPAGMLHGHAVATCMGYGAYLAMTNGFIKKEQLDRIMKLISNFELSLWHPIMDSAERVWGCNQKIIAKRGGFLCAPVPCGEIGSCGYIQDLTYEQVESSLKEYKALCESFPRGGLGVDAHCRDVGLEDPSQVQYHKQEDKLAELQAENARLRAALALAEEGLAK